MIRISQTMSATFSISYNRNGRVCHASARKNWPLSFSLEIEDQTTEISKFEDIFVKFANDFAHPFSSDYVFEPWYAGDISSQDAAQQINKLNPHSFLIRASQSSPGCFAITSKNPHGEIEHTLIQKTSSPTAPFSLCINNQNLSYFSLPELVQGIKFLAKFNDQYRSQLFRLRSVA